MIAKGTSTNSDRDHPKIIFLIVDGSQVVIIDKAITSIGRKSDNDIVINNEHVSRHHAQIRLVEGGYEILDLASTVGTSVNGKRVNQAILKPGDVISLGGMPIIYGEGSSIDGFESPDEQRIDRFDSQPTENSDLHSADEYLDLFNPQDN